MGFSIRFAPPPDDGPWSATGNMEWPLLPFLGRKPLCEWQNDAGRKEWVPGEYVNLPRGLDTVERAKEGWGTLGRRFMAAVSRIFGDSRQA